MPGLVLDTTVLIDALRGRPVIHRLRRLQRERMPLLTTVINVEEITRGLRPEEAPAAKTLFDGLYILPIGRHEGELAGHWRRDHASRGVTLHQADCLVAACAVRTNARLATGNPRDFPMPDLDIEMWQVGQ